MKSKTPRPAPTIFENATAWVGSPASVVAHTVFFISAFLIASFGLAEWDMVLLVLTTLVSLEAIYLAIFIQMSVNRQSKELEEVSEDIDEIQEDIDEIQEDVDEIQEDVEEISEDVEDIQEDVEELSEEEQAEVDAKAASTAASDAIPGMENVLSAVEKILKELEELKAQIPAKPVAPPPAVPLAKKLASVLKPKKGKAKVTPKGP